MAKEEEPAARTWIARAFTAVEDVIYLGLAVLLAASAGALLVISFGTAVSSIVAGRLETDIIFVLDRLLLILLVVELLYTVQVSFREHVVAPEPFLLVGLIAVIRRILIVTAELGQANSGDSAPLSTLIWELGVLAGLVLALAVSLAIMRKRGTGPVAERA